MQFYITNGHVSIKNTYVFILKKSHSINQTATSWIGKVPFFKFLYQLYSVTIIECNWIIFSYLCMDTAEYWFVPHSQGQ